MPHHMSTMPHDVLTARLGDLAKPDTALAESRMDQLEELILGQGLNATRALEQLGLTWRTVHNWRSTNPATWERFQKVRDTYADLAVASVDSVVSGALADVKETDPKKANAVASLWRELVRARQWAAERSSPRWRVDAVDGASASRVQVVVVLPPLAPLPTTATVASAALTDGEPDYIEHTVDDKPQLPVER